MEHRRCSAECSMQLSTQKCNFVPEIVKLSFLAVFGGKEINPPFVLEVLCGPVCEIGARDVVIDSSTGGLCEALG